MFKVKWRRVWNPFWTTMTVAGLKYDAPSDKITFYYKDGTLLEVPSWSKCYCKLGQDWVEATRKSMEKQTNQKVHLTVDS